MRNPKNSKQYRLVTIIAQILHKSTAVLPSDIFLLQTIIYHFANFLFFLMSSKEEEVFVLQEARVVSVLHHPLFGRGLVTLGSVLNLISLFLPLLQEEDGRGSSYEFI